jgi:hypothetical protein
MLQHNTKQKPRDPTNQNIKDLESYVSDIKRCLRRSEWLAEKARENANRTLDAIQKEINSPDNGI